MESDSVRPLLFVGGPASGRWITVDPPPLPYFRMPQPGPPLTLANADVSVTMPDVLYTRRTIVFRELRQGRHVMVVSYMPDDQAAAILKEILLEQFIMASPDVGET